jgi:hypothetical protein
MPARATTKRPPPPPAPPLALSIKQFCEAHNLSEAMFHKIRNAGQGPRLMHVGSRVLISLEAAAEWRKAREAETMARREAEASARHDQELKEVEG